MVRNGIRSLAVICPLVLLGSLLVSTGCQWWRRDAKAPSHQLRSSDSSMSPSGLDDRARQIESNLGVR